MTMAQPANITLFIDPFSYHFERDALFDINNGKQTGENILAPYVHLKNWFADRGVRVHTADRLLRREMSNATNVYVSFGLQNHYRALSRRSDVILSAFFAFECPVVEPALYSRLGIAQRYFTRIFSFSDSESLAPFLPGPLKLHSFRLPYALDSIRDEVWRRDKRKFLVMINHNKLPAVYWHELYTERMRAVEFFGRAEEIDLYGLGWDGPSFQMSTTWMPGTLQRTWRACLKQWQRLRPNPLLTSARRAYRGVAASKIETLGRYAFALCFENSVLKGWVTEKMFDCFVAGTIPIYWGAPDIETYVPRNCFVDMRQFGSYPELKSHLKGLGEKDIRTYKENGRDFLNSPQFRPFTKKAFAEIVARLVEEDTGAKLLDGGPAVQA